MDNEDKVNKNYDKEAYKKMKKEQLKNAYKRIDDMFNYLQKGYKNYFINYLNIQSRFDKYTVRNALLIADQAPSATKLKDYRSWKNDKVEFKVGKPKKVIVLEPGNSYVNKYGKKITPYNTKELIDIAETNAKSNDKKYDKKLILQSLLHDNLISIKSIDTDDIGISKWEKENNTIYVKCNNSDYDLVIKSITKDLAKALLYKETNETSDDKAICISYMICNKYGIHYSYEDVPNLFIDKEIKDIKNELTSMKNVFDEINNHMNLYLDNKRINKNIER